MLTQWGAALALASHGWQTAGHILFVASGLSSAAVSALAVTLLVAALSACLASAAWLGRVSAAFPLVGRSAALREKSWRAAFQRQRDPDAAGRPRPRAPSAALAAA